MIYAGNILSRNNPSCSDLFNSVQLSKPNSNNILLLFLSDSEFFSNMVVEAVTIIKQNDGRGGFKYPVKAIRILKANGKSMRESQLINGFALNCAIAMQGNVFC